MDGLTAWIGRVWPLAGLLLSGVLLRALARVVARIWGAAGRER